MKNLSTTSRQAMNSTEVADEKQNYGQQRSITEEISSTNLTVALTKKLPLQALMELCSLTIKTKLKTSMTSIE